MSSYKVYCETDDGLVVDTVEADEFRIEEGGVLVFYEHRAETISTDRKPFRALSDWDEVREVKPERFDSDLR